MQQSPKSYYKIRFGDCDMFGHLYNARYFDYLLNAREDHLREEYSLELEDYSRQGFSWFVRSHEIEYLKPAFYNERVCIQTRLLKSGKDSLHVEMLMMDEDQKKIKAILWTQFIFVNLQTKHREKHPLSFMEFASKIEWPGFINSQTLRERIAFLSMDFQPKKDL